jgi:Protein of unknown function (DUF1579).
MTDSNTPTQIKPGAGHKRLQVFVGKWNTKGQTKAGAGGEAMIITGTDSYEWLPGGFFLLHQWEVRIGSEESKGIEVIGYDEKTRSYPTYSFDNQGNIGTYQASIHDGKWAFRSRSERATVQFSEDGNTITANWEHLDGLNWQPWMEVKLKKAS